MIKFWLRHRQKLWCHILYFKIPLFWENFYPVQDILELHGNLVKVRFATSKTKLDIYFKKLDVKVAERLKIVENEQALEKSHNRVETRPNAPPPPPPEIKPREKQLKNTQSKSRYQTPLACPTPPEPTHPAPIAPPDNARASKPSLPFSQPASFKCQFFETFYNFKSFDHF